MLAFLLVMALLAIAGLAQVELDTGLKWCNGQQYKDKEYTCLDGLLCPIVWNFPYSRCGDGCYDSLYFK
jgi:hypothetical protein